jgi:uncharacterized protein (DUF1778 family)
VNITNFILESVCIQVEQEIANARFFELSSKKKAEVLRGLDTPEQLRPRLQKHFSESPILEES